MKIAIGTDHGGYGYKESLIKLLRREGNKAVDMGTFSSDPCDYPPIGAQVARSVSQGKTTRGVLLCKSGGGMAIVANKFPKVRAVVCQDVRQAKHAREHNDANILVLGAEGINQRQALAILSAWMKQPFAGGRHARRVLQIRKIERDIRHV